jgi:subtilisin family serine protease
VRISLRGCSRGGLLLAALAVAGCAVLDYDPAPRPGALDARRQLLVMIEDAPPRYQRGGTTGAGYAGHAARVRAESIAAEVARDYGLTLGEGWPMPALGLRCFVMQVAAEVPAAEMAARLAADPRVESAQGVQLFRALSRPDAEAQPPPAPRALELRRLHRAATGRGVRIAQADSGADLAHPDLAGRLVLARNFVDDGAYVPEVHGTAVAGVIVARSRDALGAGGMAPDATLLPLRACWQDPADVGVALCSTFTLAKALQFAIDREVRVINLSVGGPHDRLLSRLIDRAAARGITVVGAVDAAAPDRGFPASHPRVLAVASDDDPRLPPHAILAPGHDVLTTVPAGGWRRFSGASFAAAHVSGLAALLIETRPGLSSDEMLTVLRRGGAGEAPRVDACAALAQVGGGRRCAP